MARQPEPWRRKGRGWYAQVHGKKHRLAPDTATKQQAWVNLRALLASLPASGPPARQKELTLSEACDAFLEHSKQVHAPGTYDVYRSRLQSVCENFGGQAISTPKPSQFERWLAKVERSPSTKNGYIGALKAALRWCREEKLIAPGDPLARLKAPRKTRRETTLTPEQIGQLLEVAEPATRDLLLALAESGARPHVVLSMTAAAVDWKTGVVKGWSKGRAYEIILTARLQRRLKELALARPEGPLLLSPRGRPWNRDSAAAAFRRLSEQAGIKFTPYVLRHSFVTNALERGVNPAAVAALANHVDLAMISRVYSHLSERRELLRRAAECASGADPRQAAECASGGGQPAKDEPGPTA
jgi:integrase